jgi:cell division protease FtsH
MLANEALFATRSEMESLIAIAMGGAAAEEMALGESSTGAEADLVRATDTARDIAGRYGMSARLGRVRVLHEQREVFLGRDYLQTRDVSQPTLEHLDAEVRRIVEEQEALAHTILGANRRAFAALAQALDAEETVQGPPLAAMLAQVRLPPLDTPSPKTPAFATPAAAPAAPAAPPSANPSPPAPSSTDGRIGAPLAGPWPSPGDAR